MSCATSTAGLRNWGFSNLLNILPRINICGGLTVLCTEIPNFLNPQTVIGKFKTVRNEQTRTEINYHMKLKYEIYKIYFKQLFQNTISIFYSKRKKEKIDNEALQKLIDRTNRLKLLQEEMNQRHIDEFERIKREGKKIDPSKDEEDGAVLAENKTPKKPIKPLLGAEQIPKSDEKIKQPKTTIVKTNAQFYI